MINNGCVAYLATIGEERAEHPVLDNIPVVREYLDVFPIELMGMPENRDFEFIINLIPGTASPVSMAS